MLARCSAGQREKDRRSLSLNCTAIVQTVLLPNNFSSKGLLTEIRGACIPPTLATYMAKRCFIGYSNSGFASSSGENGPLRNSRNLILAV